MAPISAVVFDLDGTLVETFAKARLKWQAYA